MAAMAPQEDEEPARKPAPKLANRIDDFTAGMHKRPTNVNAHTHKGLPDQPSRGRAVNTLQAIMRQHAAHMMSTFPNHPAVPSDLSRARAEKQERRPAATRQARIRGAPSGSM